MDEIASPTHHCCCRFEVFGNLNVTSVRLSPVTNTADGPGAIHTRMGSLADAEGQKVGQVKYTKTFIVSVGKGVLAARRASQELSGVGFSSIFSSQSACIHS